MGTRRATQGVQPSRERERPSAGRDEPWQGPLAAREPIQPEPGPSRPDRTGPPSSPVRPRADPALNTAGRTGRHDWSPWVLGGLHAAVLAVFAAFTWIAVSGIDWEPGASGVEAEAGQAPDDEAGIAGSASLVSDVEARPLSSHEALVSWRVAADHPGVESWVEYGATGAYGRAGPVLAGCGYKAFLMEGLDAATTFHFRVRAADASGVEEWTDDQTFSTHAPPPVASP